MIKTDGVSNSKLDYTAFYAFASDIRKLQDRLAASTWPTLTLNHRNTYYVHGSNIVETAKNEKIVCSVVLQSPPKGGRCDPVVMNPACSSRGGHALCTHCGLLLPLDRQRWKFFFWRLLRRRLKPLKPGVSIGGKIWMPTAILYCTFG